MTYSLIPGKISHYINNNLLTKEEAYSLLSSFIEKSDNVRLRAQCIEELGKISTKDRINFKILENCLLSDESPLIRSLAAQYAFFCFPKSSLKPLKYLIYNEKSSYVLKNLLDFLKNHKNYYSERLIKELIDNLVKKYNLVPEESQFLLEIEALKNINSNMCFFKILKKEKFILDLDLAGQKLTSIPKSIGILLKLQNLNLWNNCLKTLPKSIGNLTNLKTLFLDWNNFSEIPNLKWDSLISLEKLNLNNNSKLNNNIPQSLFKLAQKNFARKYVEEGVIPSEAPVLSLLEFFAGMKLKKTEQIDHISSYYACNYKLNNKGHVIGIYLFGYPIFQICIFPEQVCSLKYLEELILRDQGIKNIPNKIGNLKSLKILDLMRNRVKTIPESMEKLENLEYVDISENNNIKVPEFLKSNDIDLWV